MIPNEDFERPISELCPDQLVQMTIMTYSQPRCVVNPTSFASVIENQVEIPTHLSSTSQTQLLTNRHGYLLVWREAVCMQKIIKFDLAKKVGTDGRTDRRIDTREMYIGEMGFNGL